MPEVNNEEFDKTLREIVEKMLEQGQLIVVGTKQTGKTNATMWILRNMMLTQRYTSHEIKTVIFDTVLNWRFRFDAIPFISHDRVRFLPVIQDLIVDLPYKDTRRARNAITEVIMQDFVQKAELKEKFKGEIPFLNVYVIEEMQNVLGSYSMNGFEGRFMLKMISECANFGQIIIGIGQRLADISTKVIERTRYFLIGATSGDNDLRKIKRMSNKEVAEKVKALRKGEFIFLDRENPESVDLIYFPKFIQTSEPYPHENGNGKGNGKGHVRKIFLGS